MSIEPEALTLELERKLSQEYEQLVDQLYALCQLNVYSTIENRFLFPDINKQVYQYNQRLELIAKELAYLGVKTRTRTTVVEDIVLGL